MKKKLAMIMTVVLAMGLFTACGSEEGKSLYEMNVEKYVTLGDYKGLEVHADAVIVDEAELDARVQEVYYGLLPAEEGVTDRAVEMGDTVNIDYEGKQDGVAFSGGTAAAQQLTIGSGAFISGFEDGLVGVMPGETVDLNLNFPDPYPNNPDLAGQAVVFTVTVNYIYPTEYKDEVVASWEEEGITNVAELEQYVYDYLYQTAQSEYNSAVENGIMEAFMAQCVIKEVPDSLVASYGESLQSSLEAQASSLGLDGDTYCAYAYGMDMATFVEKYAADSAKQIMAFQAVANAENLNLNDEELDAELQSVATANGFATVEEFLGENDKEEYREYYMFESVLSFLIENANIITE